MAKLNPKKWHDFNDPKSMVCASHSSLKFAEDPSIYVGNIINQIDLPEALHQRQLTTSLGLRTSWPMNNPIPDSLWNDDIDKFTWFHYPDFSKKTTSNQDQRTCLVSWTLCDILYGSIFPLWPPSVNYLLLFHRFHGAFVRCWESEDRQRWNVSMQ